MDRRILTLCLITSCLIVILAAGAGMWGIHQGLVVGPTGRIQLGQLEVMAITSVEYSTARPPRGYYVVWIGLSSEAMPSARSWRPYIWGRRLVRLGMPPPAVLMP